VKAAKNRGKGEMEVAVVITVLEELANINNLNKV
jgi:hypothetical protein